MRREVFLHTKCYYDTPVFARRTCARVRFCVSVSQTRLVVHAARWSYVNRAVSHLLWPGWESSGGPGSLWVPDLHVIHSWGGARGLGWGEYESAQIQTRKIEKGEGRKKREEGGWSASEGRVVRLRVDWQLVPRRSSGTMSAEMNWMSFGFHSVTVTPIITVVLSLLHSWPHYFLLARLPVMLLLPPTYSPHWLAWTNF